MRSSITPNVSTETVASTVESLDEAITRHKLAESELEEAGGSSTQYAPHGKQLGRTADMVLSGSGGLLASGSLSLVGDRERMASKEVMSDVLVCV